MIFHLKPLKSVVLNQTVSNRIQNSCKYLNSFVFSQEFYLCLCRWLCSFNYGLSGDDDINKCLGTNQSAAYGCLFMSHC